MGKHSMMMVGRSAEDWMSPPASRRPRVTRCVTQVSSCSSTVGRLRSSTSIVRSDISSFVIWGSIRIHLSRLVQPVKVFFEPEYLVPERASGIEHRVAQDKAPVADRDRGLALRHDRPGLRMQRALASSLPPCCSLRILLEPFVVSLSNHERPFDRLRANGISLP